jgi:transcription elongation factor Elf1
MTDEPLNALRFAADLARVRADLEHAAQPYQPIEHQDAAAAGFLTVIQELTAGTDSTTAVARALDAYTAVRTRQKEHEEATDARRRQEEQDLKAEEEITRKVECPFCGSAAGMRCRGTGASGGLKKKSHSDRYRLARGLNDATAEARKP